MLCMVGITILIVLRNGNIDTTAEDWAKYMTREQAEHEEFQRDAPLVLYLAAVELLICGACAQTAATMYTRRRHALRHPKEGTEKEKARYIQVRLEKDPHRRGAQLYGLGFRPSSDGLECLLVEDIRPGSLLDLWNQRALRGRGQLQDMAEEVIGAAGGDDAANGQDATVPAARPPERVHPGAAIVAVNHVTADVGMMQLELTKAEVTLWVRSEVYHPSQLESEVLAEPDAIVVPGNGNVEPCPPSELQVQQSQPGAGAGPCGGPGPTFLGRPAFDPEAVAPIVEPDANSGPRCACVLLEDEEPQILVRWLVCSILFGWVTLLPVILMQPHEERPRQHLFRQYLLKPCIIILPLWILLWVLDSFEVMFEVSLLHPFYYFSIVHMIFPAVLIRFLMQLQAADERLVLEQRKIRQAEGAKDHADAQPIAVEDPAPTLLRELICVNPVALVWIGAVASIPLVAFNMLMSVKTERARLAQGFVNMIYAPLIALQVAFMWVLFRVRFIDVPKLYLAAFGLLLSVPCFLVWCCCLMCASRFGRQDMALVERQRLERAKEVYSTRPLRPLAPPTEDDSEIGLSGTRVAEASPASTAEPAAADLVDLTEAMQREWELIYTA
uniref:Uncharacterized protein n=1 Tax=Zooxanthella nutricula TaxID=1333877 RepID=A0A7S2ICW5_9DINO